MDHPQLFIVTNKKEISHGIDLKTGLNIFKRSKFVVTDIKHISYQLINGYYLRFVSFPENNPDFQVEYFNNCYHTNMIILGDRFELCDSKTFEIISKLGFDLGDKNVYEWASYFKWLDKEEIESIDSNVEKILVENSNVICQNDDTSYELLDESQIEDIKKIISFSAENNDLDTIKDIISYNNYYEFINVGLFNASKYGHIEIVKYLSSIFGANNNDAVRVALENNHLDIYEYLKKFDIDLDMCLEVAAFNGHLIVVQDILFENYNPRGAFFKAAEGAKFDVIEYILTLNCLNTNDIKIAITIIKSQIRNMNTYNKDTSQEEIILDYLNQKY
ncbi:putative ankyrin repeat protein [Powai lake megavirus]|uniref:Putative ankyrin repeat protein n=1 Tax=Powai lake megavirus TaxID=1842663 RepID=A0A167R3V3_9VIRU|nr:putative ankyrin repeat protein [Powai lake megavirus]ANB50282.1 putative ankyrin repeat protein [Powai lake megavirus]